MATVTVREAGALLRGAFETLRPVRPEAVPLARPAQPPVLLVHGYLGHARMLAPLARRLRSEGIGVVDVLGYPSTRWTFERILDALARRVHRLARTHGQVDLVGHSLGAVASRAFVKLYGGHDVVRHVVALGGPFGGTALHRIVPSPIRQVLDPQGPWVARLAQGDEPVPTTVIRARLDHQVLPPTRATLPGLGEIVVEGHGHNGLLFAREAHDAVVEALLAGAAPDQRS